VNSNKKLMPPAYFLAALVLMVALHFIAPLAVAIPDPWYWVGVPLIVLGILFVIAPARKFDVAGTTIKPFQESTALVTSGFFAVSRNPMYLGMTLMLAGIAMLLRSASPFVVVLAFPIVIDRRFIVFEEQSLERTFGADFRQYKARVRRWL